MVLIPVSASEEKIVGHMEVNNAAIIIKDPIKTSFQEVFERLNALIENKEHRLSLGDKAGNLIDGKGAVRVIDAMKIYQLTRNKKTAVFRLNKELEFKMRFGWLTLSLSSSPHEDKQNIDNVLIQAQEAERLGFEDVWLTEHYFTGESVYNDALLFAAALAMKTEKIRIGFSGADAFPSSSEIGNTIGSSRQFVQREN